VSPSYTPFISVSYTRGVTSRTGPRRNRPGDPDRKIGLHRRHRWPHPPLVEHHEIRFEAGAPL